MDQGYFGSRAEGYSEFSVLTVISLQASSVPLVNYKGLHKFSKSVQIKRILWDYCVCVSMQQEKTLLTSGICQ